MKIGGEQVKETKEGLQGFVFCNNNEKNKANNYGTLNNKVKWKFFYLKTIPFS